MPSLIAILMWYYAQIAQGNTTPEIIRDYAVVESQVAQLSLEDQNKVLTVIKNESGFNPSRLHKNDGAVGCDSRGLVQIRSCNHDTTDQEAYNPVYSVNFLIKNIDKCNTWWKSTCPLPKS